MKPAGAVGSSEARVPDQDRSKGSGTGPRGSGLSEVAEGVFIGGLPDAPAFEGDRICVLDERPERGPVATFLPIYDPAQGRADRRNLDRVIEAVERSRARGRPVLIFCGHGVRRSPLAAAWLLHETEHISLEAAYERIRAVRPQVEDAREWVDDLSDLDRD